MPSAQLPDSSHDESARARIAASGLRVTRQRVAVVESLAFGEHLDVEAITIRTRAAIGSVSHQAVYDVLAALTGAGLLRRIEPAGAPSLFEIRVADNHHHLVCRGCRAVADVDCAVGSAPCLTPAAGQGFVLDEAEVTWWGLCRSCQ
jgi:Fur family ferric uptake transcriptional regulator